MAKKGKRIKVDFEGVESGGGAGVSKEGDYTVEVENVSEEVGQGSGQPYLAWEFRVAEGKFKGRKLYHNTSLQPQALFNLRNLLEALGVDVPDSELDLNLSDFVGERLGVTVEMEEYQGKDKPRIVAFFADGEGNITDDEDDDSDDDDDDDDSDDDDDDDDSDDDDSDEDDDKDEDDSEDEDDESDDDDSDESDDEDEDDEDDDEDEDDAEAKRKADRQKRRREKRQKEKSGKGKPAKGKKKK